MRKRAFYIKGYKLDRQKICNTFPREEHEPDDIYELAWYQLIVEGIVSFVVASRTYQKKGILALHLIAFCN